MSSRKCPPLEQTKHIFAIPVSALGLSHTPGDKIHDFSAAVLPGMSLLKKVERFGSELFPQNGVFLQPPESVVPSLSIVRRGQPDVGAGSKDLANGREIRAHDGLAIRHTFIKLQRINASIP
jgi:hypothetical protein